LPHRSAGFGSAQAITEFLIAGNISLQRDYVFLTRWISQQPRTPSQPRAMRWIQ